MMLISIPNFQQLCMLVHESTHYVWFKTVREDCFNSSVLFALTDVKHLLAS